MEIELLPSQYDVLSCQEPVAAMTGGIGAGKTHALSHFVLNEINSYPRVGGLVVANTYTQLMNATIPAITSLLDELGIPNKPVLGGAKKHIMVNGSTPILIYSLENYDVIRGIEVGWIAGDEIAYTKREALNVVMGRLRHKRGSLKARWFTSPKGFNWFYDYIREQDIPVFKSKTRDNYHLPEQYYQSLVELYGGESSPLARQELFGEFVNLTSNSIYFAFNREKHVASLSYNPLLPIYIGCDFNAGNMNYVAIQFDRSGFKVIEAVTLKDHMANTFSMAQELWSKFQNRAIVIPDSTANARKTSAEAGVTDIRILTNIGLRVDYKTNPRIKDRHNAVNIALHKNRVMINESCKDLIKEIETVTHDDDEGTVSHAAVALGYVIWRLEPIMRNSLSELPTNPFLR